MQTDAHISYWEKEHWLHYDLAIVGAGITGLSVAAEYLERFPHHKVAVFERGLLPTGASTKNAGFACFGSPTEILSDIEAMGESAALKLLLKRYQGLQMLFKRFNADKAGLEILGGYELLNEAKALDNYQLDSLNTLLQSITSASTFSVVNEKIQMFGFNPDHVQQLIFNPFEGQIDSGILLKSMYQYAISLGAMVFTGAQVEVVYGQQGGTVLKTTSLGKVVDFKAKKSIICTNAFAKLMLPQLDIKPGRGQILMTEPIENLALKGTFHFDEGYYYFRNVGNRILIGGGRNADFVGEESLEFETTENIQKVIEDLLFTVIIPGQKIDIAHRWSGIMAFGSDKSPIVQQLEPNIFCALRGSGMGVALASHTAKVVIDQL